MTKVVKQQKNSDEFIVDENDDDTALLVSVPSSSHFIINEAWKVSECFMASLGCRTLLHQLLQWLHEPHKNLRPRLLLPPRRPPLLLLGSLSGSLVVVFFGIEGRRWVDFSSLGESTSLLVALVSSLLIKKYNLTPLEIDLNCNKPRLEGVAFQTWKPKVHYYALYYVFKSHEKMQTTV